MRSLETYTHVILMPESCTYTLKIFFLSYDHNFESKHPLTRLVVSIVSVLVH